MDALNFRVAANKLAHLGSPIDYSEEPLFYERLERCPARHNAESSKSRSVVIYVSFELT